MWKGILITGIGVLHWRMQTLHERTKTLAGESGNTKILNYSKQSGMAWTAWHFSSLPVHRP